MTAPPATIRTATEDDLRAIDAVLRANHGPPPGEPAEPPGAQDPYLLHLISRGTFAVAESDGAMIVGLSRGRLNGFGRWTDRAMVAPDEEPVSPLIALIRRGPTAAT